MLVSSSKSKHNDLVRQILKITGDVITIPKVVPFGFWLHPHGHVGSTIILPFGTTTDFNMVIIIPKLLGLH
jgi:hypothetical protein